MFRPVAAASMLVRYLLAATLVVLNLPLVLPAYLFFAIFGVFGGLLVHEGLLWLGIDAVAGRELAFAAAGYVCFLALMAVGVLEEVGERVDELATEGTEPEPDHPVRTTVRRLSQQVGIPTPDVLLLPDESPEAFSLSRDGTPTVVVSEGLLETLSARELEAVLAHELAHVRNADFRLMSWLLYAVVAADTFYDPAEFETRSLADWFFRGYAAVASVLPRAATGTVGRGREFAADRGAVAITGDPAGLAAALRDLADETVPTRDARLAFAAANVVPLYEPDGLFRRFTRTHPETAARIERLERLVEE